MFNNAVYATRETERRVRARSARGGAGGGSIARNAWRACVCAGVVRACVQCARGCGVCAVQCRQVRVQVQVRQSRDCGGERVSCHEREKGHVHP